MNALVGLPQLPSDVDIEQAVIGGCLVQPERIPSVEALCQAQQFFHNPHPRIVVAMFGLAKEGRAVTPLTIQGEIGSDIGLDISTADYLAQAAGASPVAGLIDNARRIADLALRRDAMLALMDAQEQLAVRDMPLSDAMRPVLEVSDRVISATGRRDFTNISDAAQSMLRRAQDALEGKTVPAVTTGLAKLDEVIGGLQAGDLAVYAGRPGMGKSALLMTTALAAARQNRPTIVFSLEMSQERLLERMGCDIDFDAHHLDPLSYHWFRKGDLRAHQVERMAQAVRRMPDNLKIFDRGDLTIHEIASLARAEAQRSSRMGVVVIDYLQKVRATDRYAGNKVQEITEISGAAKALAMRIGWPVVVGAQLNRGVESREEKTPTLSDLRESGAIEQDADQVVGLYRPAYYIGKKKPAGGSMDPRWNGWLAEYEPVKNHLDLFVLKNRHGEENSVKVHCDMRASAIRDEAPR